MELEGSGKNTQDVLGSAFIILSFLVVSGPASVLGVPGPISPFHVTGTIADAVDTIAVSQTEQFVGAVGYMSSLFVGLLNGTVIRMDSLSGRITGLVELPDGNSAAHLTYYNGSLYVGTEWLHGAKDQAPFHVYEINPRTMKILNQVTMNPPYANGFILAFNGFLWAGDGHCTLYKINPNDLEVMGTVPGVAEDEMVFDGTHYWTECRNVVNVLLPVAGTPAWMASGSLSLPNRPRGFFLLDNLVYSSGNINFTLYSMSIHGSTVLFRGEGTLGNQSLPTRDTTLFGGLLYVYETGPGADSGQFPGRVFVYEHDLRLKRTIWLTGPALTSDASQHTLFALNGRLYFVTESSVGYIEPIQVRVSLGLGNWPPLQLPTEILIVNSTEALVMGTPSSRLLVVDLDSQEGL
ncbi:MAG TPA: hypothetical protein VED22_00085 [Nitrososphaerales archaeon]|nr:hypothetical protein [Nitrososphaerales archaeon]